MNLPDGLFVVDEMPGETVHIYDRAKTNTPFRKDAYRTSLCGQSWGDEREERSTYRVRDRRTCGTCLRILDSVAREDSR